MEMETKPTPRVCTSCAREFIIHLPTGTDPIMASLARMMSNLRRCEACIDREKRAEQEAEANERRRARECEWSEICPPTYRETQLSLLPSKDAHTRVMQWAFGRTGLILHGPTGLGKSRSAWLLLRREFDNGRTVGVLDSAAAFRYAAAFGQSAAKAERWFDHLTTREILFLDDVFKARLTDSFEQMLFALVEARTSHLRPIIATTNDTAETLGVRLSEDRGAPLLRRLREFCQSVSFE